MNTFVFALHGKPPALAELKALFETYNFKFNLLKSTDELILVKSNATADDVIKICKRSSHIRDASILISELKDLRLTTLTKVNWTFVKNPFAVRVHDLLEKEHADIERRLASPIWDYLVKNGKNPSVNLDKPKTTIHFIIGKKIFLTKKLWGDESGKYKKREPNKRPAFHPATLKPKMARLQIDIQTIASDFDPKSLSGAKANVKFYKKFGNVNFLKSDVKDLDKHLKQVDAIVTDPPYGRSSRVGAKSVLKLYQIFLNSSAKVLKKNGHVSFLYPHYIKVNKLINKKKWKTIAKSEIYAHGGLTRKILVLKLKSSR